MSFDFAFTKDRDGKRTVIRKDSDESFWRPQPLIQIEDHIPDDELTLYLDRLSKIPSSERR